MNRKRTKGRMHRQANGSQFKVVMYQGEYRQFCNWVLKHENLETGGDLFGLWADERTAVIQLVLGPGRNCRRTSTSFYQDIEYLETVGSYLTERESLCHIGEWHSHHQLGLERPSGGDESTVWNNLPKYGLDRFLLFIANIRQNYQAIGAKAGCFLFEFDKQTRWQKPVSKGELEIIGTESPIRLKLKDDPDCKAFSGMCESQNSTNAMKTLKFEENGYQNLVYRKKEQKPGTGKAASRKTEEKATTIMNQGRTKGRMHRQENGSQFKVVMYQGEYRQLCNWVLKHENLETGGDLFGLWADERTAVIQLVLGPGRNCRKTSVSFYQDIEYLETVGSYLTERESLCHIGEWHSHHQLGLERPSGGDESTVWNNLPKYGLDRFLLFIANIQQNDRAIGAKAGCFLFEFDKQTGWQKPVSKGELEIIGTESPIRLKLKEDPDCKAFSGMCESQNFSNALKTLKFAENGYENLVYREKEQRSDTTKVAGKNKKGKATNTGRSEAWRPCEPNASNRASPKANESESESERPNGKTGGSEMTTETGMAIKKEEVKSEETNASAAENENER